MAPLFIACSPMGKPEVAARVASRRGLLVAPLKSNFFRQTALRMEF
jgi:hypothetical protein